MDGIGFSGDPFSKFDSRIVETPLINGREKPNASSPPGDADPFPG